MALHVKDISAKLGVSNRLMVLFLAETHPEYGITDASKHHNKEFSWWVEDDAKSPEDEIREQLAAFVAEHPELADDAQKPSAKKKSAKSSATTKKKSSGDKPATTKATATKPKSTTNSKSATTAKKAATKPATKEKKSATTKATATKSKSAAGSKSATGAKPTTKKKSTTKTKTSSAATTKATATKTPEPATTKPASAPAATTPATKPPATPAIPKPKPAPVPPPIPTVVAPPKPPIAVAPKPPVSVAPKIPVPPPPVPRVTPPPVPPIQRPKIAPIPPIPPPSSSVRTVAPLPPRPAPVKIPPSIPVPRPAPAVPSPFAPKPAPILPPPKISVPPPVPRVAPPVPPTPAVGAPGATAETAAAAPAPSELKKVSVRAPVVVRDLATTLNIRPFRLISELMSMGIFASLNQDLKDEIACKVAEKFGVELEIHRREKGAATQRPAEPVIAKPVDDEKDKVLRPPVVCVLGHVDHGKTTLLDYYRKSNVTAGEAGGITQHVAAYSVKRNDKQITFLDTPGHAAFSKMRERGAALTDIAVLVVAADDGFMPQTDEALKFAQKNNVQLVVAINKIDAKGANVDRVKQQMQARGITSEDWGGTIQCEPVSALKGTGMESLLDAILLQAEIMELKANPKCAASGTVVEAQMEQGRGPTATVIVNRGTLKPGDALVCGPNFCRVRAILDEYGKPLKNISPGCPGRVMGWSGIPSAGAVFSAVKNAREAERIADENKYKLRKAIEEEEENAKNAELEESKNLSDMERLNALIAGTSEKVFKVVTKADVDGTLEALNASLEAIKSKRVKLEIVGGSVGPITQNDVNMASASGATIVAFDVKPDNGVPAILKRQNVKVISHEIIYMLLDTVKEAMAELLDPELKENRVGLAEARVIYPYGKNAFVAGSMVTEGSIRRDFNARVLRKGEVMHTGRIDTLKRFKDDVTEVKAGYECGIRVTGFEAYQEGDIIECYEILKIRPPL